MSKSTKLLLTGFAVMLFVLIIVAYALPRLANPNNYKTIIAAMIKEKTGRDVVFKGAISLAVFPWMGVSADKVEVRNKPGFQGIPFMAVEKTKIRVKLLPLLAKKVEINSIALEGLILNLTKDKQGINNWDDLFAPNTASQPSIANAKIDVTTDKKSLPAGLPLGGITIKNARVSWDNQQTGGYIKLNNIRFDSDKFVFGEPVKINMAMDISGDFVTFPLSVKWVTGLRVDEKLVNFAFSDSLIEGVGYKNFTNGQSIAASVTAPTAEINIVQQSFRIPSLQFKSGDLNLTAEIIGEQFIDKPSIHGSAKIAPFNPRIAMKQWDFAPPAMSDGTALNKLSMAFDFRAALGQAEFSNLDVHLDNSHGKGSVTVKGFVKPTLLFNLTVDNIDADRYLAPQDKSAASSPATAFAPGKYALSLDWFRELDAEGNLTLSNMTLNNMSLQDMHLTLSSKKSIVKIGQGMNE